MATGIIPKYADGKTKNLTSGITYVSATNYSNQTRILRQGNFYYIYLMVTIKDKNTDSSSHWVVLFTHSALSNISGRFVVYNSNTNNVAVCRIQGEKMIVNPSAINIGDIIYGSACILG